MTPDMKDLLIERTGRPENLNDPTIDLGIIDQERLDTQSEMVAVVALQTWGLQLNSQIPDVCGIKRLLDERYGHSIDDIPHELLFV